MKTAAKIKKGAANRPQSGTFLDRGQRLSCLAFICAAVAGRAAVRRTAGFKTGAVAGQRATEQTQARGRSNSQAVKEGLENGMAMVSGNATGRNTVYQLADDAGRGSL